MNKFLALGLFNLLARLPLPLLHRLGALLGWLAFRLSAKYAARLRENLRRAFPELPDEEYHRLLSDNVREAGKGAAELPWIWRRPAEQVLAKVRSRQGWEWLQAAQAKGKGVIVLLPHMGCFEVVCTLVGEYTPSVSMYRVPKLAWLDPVMRAGRERGRMKLARADVSGVRTLFKALKQGEVIGILPDQVPGNGEGEWVPFFGRPAYTMTLVSRLIEKSDAPVVMCHAERLPDGQGYDVYFSPLEFDRSHPFAPQINRAVESVVKQCPAQYLWSYNRYKIPRGVQPPLEEGA